MSTKFKMALVFVLLLLIAVMFCGCAAVPVAAGAAPPMPVALPLPSASPPPTLPALRPGEERLAPMDQERVTIFNEVEDEVRWRVEHAEDGEVFVGYHEDAGQQVALYGTLQLIDETQERVLLRVENPRILSYDQCYQRLLDLRKRGQTSMMTLRVLLGWRGRSLPQLSADGTTLMVPR